MADDVTAWMSTAEGGALAPYTAAMLQGGYDIPRLRSLSDADAKEVAKAVVTDKAGIRKKLERAIRDLKGAEVGEGGGSLAPLSPVPTQPQAVAPHAAQDSPAQTLQRLRIPEVRKCAAALGVTEDEIDDAEEEDDERACLVGLVMDRLATLKKLKIKDLRSEASSRGIANEQVKAVCENAEDRKAAIIGLILDNVVAANATSPAAAASKSPGSAASPATTQAFTIDDGAIEILDEVLGRGGSGVVRGATYTRKSGEAESVAAKILAPGATEREHQKFAEEFAMSLKLATQCQRACRVYGAWRHNEAMCIIMKRYEQNFQAVLDSFCDASGKRRPLTVSEAVPFGLQIALALEVRTPGILRRTHRHPSSCLFLRQG